MKWFKTLSAKVTGGRRRLEGSQDSNNKKRSLKRKASISSRTESDKSWDDAKWRVENILVNGPPSEAEWWGEGCLANEEHDHSVGLDDGVLVPHSPSEHRTTTGSTTMRMDSSPSSSRSPSSSSSSSPSSLSSVSSRGCFHNCGYDTWEVGRAEWRVPIVIERPPRPPPIRYEQIARGLQDGSRTFELPGRMRLKDLVALYAELWDCDSDPW